MVGPSGCLLLDAPRLPLSLRLLGCPKGLDGPVDQPMLKAAAPAARGLGPTGALGWHGWAGITAAQTTRTWAGGMYMAASQLAHLCEDGGILGWHQAGEAGGSLSSRAGSPLLETSCSCSLHQTNKQTKHSKGRGHQPTCRAWRTPASCCHWTAASAAGAGAGRPREAGPPAGCTACPGWCAALRQGGTAASPALWGSCPL